MTMMSLTIGSYPILAMTLHAVTVLTINAKTSMAIALMVMTVTMMKVLQSVP